MISFCLILTFLPARSQFIESGIDSMPGYCDVRKGSLVEYSVEPDAIPGEEFRWEVTGGEIITDGAIGEGTIDDPSVIEFTSGLHTIEVQWQADDSTSDYDNGNIFVQKESESGCPGNITMQRVRQWSMPTASIDKDNPDFSICSGDPVGGYIVVNLTGAADFTFSYTIRSNGLHDESGKGINTEHHTVSTSNDTVHIALPSILINPSEGSSKYFTIELTDMNDHFSGEGEIVAGREEFTITVHPGVEVGTIHPTGINRSLSDFTDTICFNDTVIYDIPGDNDSEYLWDITGGSVIYSSANKDSVIITWNIDEGPYSIGVSKLSENLCASATKVLDIFVHDAVIDLGEDIAICEGSSEMIVFDPGYEEYLWNGQPGTNEFTAISGGIVTLEVEDKYGCRAKDQINIIENINPVPDFTVNAGMVNQSVSLSNLSDSLWQYYWDFGDGTYSDDYNPGTHTYPDPGIYEIILTASADGCSGMTSRIVSISETLTSGFEAEYEGCIPVEITFINHSTGADRYLWDFGNGEFSEDENPRIIFEEAGEYEVTLYAKKDTFVRTSKNRITLAEGPNADFIVNTSETYSYRETTFNNMSVNAVRYLWNFGDGEFSESYEPVHSYLSEGVYDISLSVWSETGCFDSLTVPDAITVIPDCRLKFPNGFIPDKNGPTGGYYNPARIPDNNEIFHPIYRNINEYELKIFNRWGELVFTSRNINVGWDGYYRGRLAPQDTYLYVVRATCPAGNEISETGSVTLIY